MKVNLLYLFFWFLVFAAGRRLLLGHAQLGVDSGRVLTTDGSPRAISDALNLKREIWNVSDAGAGRL